MKPFRSIIAVALLAALPAVGYAQTSAKTSPSPVTTKSSPATTKSTSTTTTTTASSPATTTTTTSSPAAKTSAGRTDVYHVHFTHAAPGKAAALADALKTPDPNAPMPGHSIMFRHQEGDSWDYCVVEHLGTKATVQIAPTMPAASAATRDASDSHTDTFVSGPAWADFAKAMGINEGAGKSAIYIVSVYRATPGHREQLDTAISTVAPGDPAAGTVVMQHLEGAAWTFFGIARYATWEDFVKSETSSLADQAKNTGGWAAFREHCSYHTDTLADRLMP
ncbi:MAG TPA: hypothetical protein VLH83_05165 [Chthoniobacterales bacterium]|nr:hypothetical protein [Chthoniobacterales bacterium]